MSTEHIGGNDALPPQPPSGDGSGDEKPGFPPDGYDDDRRAREGNEAASRAEENPEAVLAALEAGSETPTQRQQRLGQFIEEHFSDVSIPAVKALAVERCTVFEDGCRELFEEPDLQLGDEDAADPELQDKLANLSRHVIDVAENDEAIAVTTTERDQALAREATNAVTIEANSEDIGGAQAETAALQRADALETNGLSEDEAKNAEVNRDLATVADLDANFEALRAEHGTIGALKSLLDPEMGVKSPEMKAIVQRAVATSEALVSAIPGKEAKIGRLLDSAGLNLAGVSLAEMFAGVLTAAATSEDFTEDDVETLRAVVSGADANIKTGTDVLNTATETVIDAETGLPVPRYTEDNKAEIYPGVYTYTENGENAILELSIDGHHHKIDVSGMDGMTVGLIAEMMSWQAATETMGATSFVESVYKLDFNFTGAGAYDVFSLVQMRNKLTTLVGNFEGHDGDIFDPRTREGLIKDQMRAASPTGMALGWENDHNGSLEHSRKLGLHNDVVLEEFARYIQTARSTGGAIDPADMHANLYKKFPDLVEPPKGQGPENLT